MFISIYVDLKISIAMVMQLKEYIDDTEDLINIKLVRAKIKNPVSYFK